jgi:hypothetical protein
MTQKGIIGITMQQKLGKGLTVPIFDVINRALYSSYAAVL